MPGSLLDRENIFYRAIELIRQVKYSSMTAAESFRKGAYRVALGRATEAWGYAPSYFYEMPPGGFNYADATKKTLLAALIAERHLLFAFRGLRKHMTVSIIGLAGSGKTTYAILSGIGAYLLAGLDWGKAVELTPKQVFFTPKSLVDFLLALLREARSDPRRGWVPFIIMDDAGAQISKYWHMIGERHYSQLFSVLDQVKDFTGMLVITARSEKSLPARLREITDYFAEAGEVEIEGHVVDLFKFYKGTDFLRGERARAKGLRYLDAMPPIVRMPDELWQEMMNARAETAERRLTILREALELAPALEKAEIEKVKSKLKSRAETALGELEEIEGEIDTPTDEELEDLMGKTNGKDGADA